MTRLQDCELDIDLALFNQEATLGQLDPKWTSAKENNLIPASLFRLYSKADYFGIGKAPKYLTDTRKLLFPYLEGMTRGMRDSLVEAEKFVRQVPILDANSYNPKKSALGQPFDPSAADEIVSVFKYALVNLSGALDQFAEISGIMLFPDIEFVKPGKASFREIMRFVEAPAKARSSILTPREHFTEKLKSTLAPYVNSAAPQKDWLKLLFLYRNKLAHLGTSAFQLTCLHNKDGDFFTFLPRQWPDFFKQHMQPAAPGNSAPKNTMREHALRDLMHCDMVEFTENLHKIIMNVLESGLDVICNSYKNLKDCEPNEMASTQIIKNSEAYEFEYFGEAI